MAKQKTIYKVFLGNRCYVRGTLDEETFANDLFYLPTLALHKEELLKLMHSTAQCPITYILARAEILDIARHYLTPYYRDAEQIFACTLLLYDCTQDTNILTITVQNVFEDAEEAK